MDSPSPFDKEKGDNCGKGKPGETLIQRLKGGVSRFYEAKDYESRMDPCPGQENGEGKSPSPRHPRKKEIKDIKKKSQTVETHDYEKEAQLSKQRVNSFRFNYSLM